MKPPSKFNDERFESVAETILDAVKASCTPPKGEMSFDDRRELAHAARSGIKVLVAAYSAGNDVVSNKAFQAQKLAFQKESDNQQLEFQAKELRKG